MKKGRIPTILGIAFLLSGIAAGVALIQSRQVFKLGASPEITPKNVRVSNITEGSFTISWVTDKATFGFVRWGGGASPDKVKIPPSSTPSFTHSVSIGELVASSTYYFNINSDGKDFDNNGVSWKVKTGPSLPEQPEANVISGSVVNTTQNPVDGALVYAQIGGSSLLSTTTGGGGKWAIPISTARTQTLGSFMPINETTTLVEIVVEAGVNSISSAQVYPASAKPVPPIVLGRTQNFRSLNPEKQENVPDASISLPQQLPLPTALPTSASSPI